MVEYNQNTKKNIVNQGQTGVEVSIAEDELQWLSRSAIGKMRKSLSCQVVHSAMFLERVTARVRLVGGLNMLVIFGDKDKMETLLESYNEIFELWFDSISPYNVEVEIKSYTV
ncbi:hypothetical protein QUC31_007534 [Theobroma cacao]